MVREMFSQRTKAVLSVVAVATLIGSAALAQGEVEFKPSLEVKGLFDDNVLLAPSGEKDDFVVELDAGVALKHRISDETSARYRYKFAMARYNEYDDQDTHSHTLDARLKQKFTSEFAVLSGYDEATLTVKGAIKLHEAEPTGADPEETAAYRKYTLGVGTTHKVAPETSVGWEYGYYLKDFTARTPDQEDGHHSIALKILQSFARGTFGLLKYQYDGHDSDADQYDYDAHRILGFLQTKLDDALALQLLAQYQMRDYDAYDDDLIFADISLTQELTENLSAVIGYTFQSRDSSEPTRDYTKNKYSLGFEVRF